MPATTQTLCYNCFQQVTDPTQPCPHCGFDLAENQQKFPVALRAGTILNNRYIVGRVLGQGGFGITYVAFDTQLQARVAIKEYMPSDIATRVEGATVSVMMDTKSDDFTYGAERFQEEARTLAKFIGHPNIAGVSSYFDENDTSYFVMDYIEGVSFKSYIANNGGKVSVEETLNVMIPVLRALTAVHNEGFIHRDVTPDNIYISKDGNVKLLDFGSARYSIGDKSKSLDVILKVGYAPKEQYIRRGRQGPYTDVYSCAACFYAALTGYLPPESLERLDQDTLVSVSQAGVEVPEWLDKAILKGLAVQPEDRFQSAAEFLDAIENQLVVDVPVSEQTAPAPQKKPKTALIAGVAAALVVVVGVGAFLAGRGGGGTAPDSSTPGSSGGGSVLGALTGQDDGLPRLKKSEVPSITIRGEEYSTDLRELDLSGLELTDEEFESLKYMVNLTKLNLSDNNLSDLSPLSGLTELQELRLGKYNPNIMDLSPLAGMTNMEILALPPNSEIRDLSPLAGMTDLESLFMEGEQGSNPVSYINDLSPLSGMTKIIELNLTVDEGTDITPLANLTELENIYLVVGSIEGGVTTASRDLSCLSNLKKLTRLSLHPLDIDSFEGIEGAAHLQEIFFGNYISGGVTDLTPLASLTRLQSANIWTEGDVDLSPLKNLDRLHSLNIYQTHNTTHTGISDLGPVEHVANVNISP